MTEAIDVFEDQYLSRLAQRAAEWQVKFPEKAKEIRETVRQQFAIAGKPDAEPGSLRWQIFEAAVVEAIRVKAGWPTARQHMLKQGIGVERPAPRVTPPVVERGDHKARASGERE